MTDKMKIDKDCGHFEISDSGKPADLGNPVPHHLMLGKWVHPFLFFF